MTSLEVGLKLLAVLLLVGANAFFVAAEFALVSVQDARLAQLVAKGDRLARTVRSAQKDLNLYLSSCQVGITLASLGLGWIGEPAIARSLVTLFSGLPEPLAVVSRHVVAGTIAFILITYLHVVLGEVAPKTAAILHPEHVARWMTRPLILFTRAGAPLIWSINESANLLLRIFGVRLPTEAERVHSPEEIKLLVRRSRELGKVDQDEQAMIYGVFDLTTTIVREVMTPRPDIVAVRTDVTRDDLIQTASRSGFSRLPVYKENLDKVVGIVLVKDLLPLIAVGEEAAFDVSRIMREPYYVPDTKSVYELLADFRRLKIHMAVVVDEFGGTDGLVTLEDLIEEIVGEIYDEYDVARPIFTTSAHGEPLIDGGAPLDEVNERFGLTLPLDDYDTLGGFILGELGHVPKRGDTVHFAGAELVVEKVVERRVRLVRLLKETDRATLPLSAGPKGQSIEGGPGPSGG
ncbi:MAG: HlyC/CorC family transporter [Gemmatimonadota bacterium]|nr:MAG: HlyC/CorC family transporter [Gemmatimonadota bacterium]